MTIYRGTGTTSNGTAIEDYLVSKVERSGDTMTGPLNVPSGASGTQVPQRGEIDAALALKANLISPVLVTPNLGTPSAGVLTNCTGTASGLTAGTVTTNANLTGHITSVGNATSLGSFTSAQLATALTDETGSGSAVFATSPTLVTPNLGTPSAGVLTNCTGTASGLSIGGNAATATTATTATTANALAATAGEKLTQISVTQATGALTIAGVAKYLDFRSATLTSGTPSTVNADPADLVIPSGATLGSVTTVSARIIVVEMNNAGTSEYAVANISGGLQMDETNLISTTAIDTASDAANVWYSTTARSNLPYRVVACFDAVNTAGAWGNPTLVQPAGGGALTAMNSLGYGQTWQDVTGSRALATTYYNTTGKPILVNFIPTFPASSSQANFTINGVVAMYAGSATAIAAHTMTGIVPIGGSYSVTNTGTAFSWSWAELR